MGRHSTGSLPGGLTRGRQKKGFKTAFGIEIVTEIEALLGTVVVDEWDLEAIETAARRMAMRVAARVVEQRLNADTSDHAGPMLPCACGQSARYAGRHGKNFESVLGPLRLERAYYHCELCEAGFCPRDRALGLQGGSLSPGVLRMASFPKLMQAVLERRRDRPSIWLGELDVRERGALHVAAMEPTSVQTLRLMRSIHFQLASRTARK